MVQVYPQGAHLGRQLFLQLDRVHRRRPAPCRPRFNVNYPDPKAGIILTAERAGLGTVDFWTVLLHYNGPTPPPGVFDNVTAIKPFRNTCKTCTVSQLVSWNNWAVVRGSVYTIGTETVPLPTPPPPPGSGTDGAADVALAALEDVNAHWRTVSKTVLAVPGLIASTAY